MGRLRAALGSVVFLLVAPGVVAGLVPWGLTGWRTTHPPIALAVAGGVLIALGAGVLVHAFARFVIEGAGTPAPVAPTERLVVGGLYRYVRNPMYVAVGATIVGQALLLGRPGLLGYAAVFAATVLTFVRGYEEPTLSDRYGDEYARYRRAVPGWWPRGTAWVPDAAERVAPGDSEPRRSPMADEHDAADTEREMQEHEAEARERDPEERSDKGTGAGDASADSPAPPGSLGEGTTTGS